MAIVFDPSIAALDHWLAFGIGSADLDMGD